MADKKLESFKIGDTRKPMVGSAKKAPSTQPEPVSIGFKRIEGLLDGDPTEVRESLAALQANLAEFEKKSSANKDKAAAKKAIVAVEKTRDLMEHLYKTKEGLIEKASR